MASESTGPRQPPAGAVPAAGGGTGAVAGAVAALTADGERVAASRRLHRTSASLPQLQRLAALAARLLSCGSSRVSLLGEVQSVLATAGPQPAAGPRPAGPQPTGPEHPPHEHPLEEWPCCLAAAGDEPLVIGDATLDERVAGLPPVTGGALRSYLGVPLRTEGGGVVGVLCVFGPAVRAWSEQDVALLQQVAASAAAELELSALSADHEVSQVLLDVSVQAAGIGTFDLHLPSGQVVWDEQMHRLFGLAPGTSTGDLDAVLARIHPDDRDAVRAAVQQAVAADVRFAASYRVLLPGGGTRWLQGRGRVLRDACGAPSRLVGAAHDVSAEREAAERTSAALESMAVGYVALDARWRMTYVNAEAERITGFPREDLLGRDVFEAFPAVVGTVFEERYRRAAAGETVSFDAYYPEPLNTWVEVRAAPADGGVVVHFIDISARRREQEAAESAAARLELMSAVSTQLSETLDAEQAVARLAQLVVPTLADWCVVTLVDDDAHAATDPRPAAEATDLRLAAGARARAQAHRGLRDVGWWHRDEAARPLVEAYTRHRLPELGDTSHLDRVRQAARPVAVRSGAAPAIAAVLGPGRARELVLELAPESFTVLPLRGRGRTVGLLTLFSGAARAPLTEEELAVATELADRAGLALDSSRLYRQQRDLAEGLQRSLLTEPVQPGHAQVVVRYLPAAEAAQVGGDWYDAFTQRGGDTVLVIGDVVGHDTQAAAAMSQVRSTVRSFGALDDATPATVLRQTDEVMATLHIATTATAFVARLERSEQDLARGVTRLRWSNAGHPPAMVVNPDGSVAPLLAPSPDLLLGVSPRTRRRESEVTLDRGATVLLFTDGLVERHDQPVHEGLELLQDTLERLARLDLGLDALCDQVLARMLPDQREDDVALLAVRLDGRPGAGRGTGGVTAGAEVLLPAGAGSAGRARRHVRDFLTPLLDPAGAPEPAGGPAEHEASAPARQPRRLDAVVADAEVCVSELVTNAVLHAGTELTVAVRLRGDLVRLEVHDGSRVEPHWIPRSLTASTGRGLTLISALSTAHGVDVHARGKVVWCDVPTTSTAGERQDEEDAAAGAADDGIDPSLAEQWSSVIAELEGVEVSGAGGAGDPQLPPPPVVQGTVLEGAVPEGAVLEGTVGDAPPEASAPGASAPDGSIHLLRYPVRRGMRMREHREAVLRELRILGLTRAIADPAVAALAAGVGDLLSSEYAGHLTPAAASVVRALAVGETRVDLRYPRLADHQRLVDQWLVGMGHLERLSADAGLGMLATPPDVRELQQWVMDEFTAQLRGREPRPWQGPLD